MLFQKLLRPAESAGATGIQYVGGYTTSYTGTATTSVSLTSLTGGIASAPSIGDLVIFCIGNASDGTTTINMGTSDYTSIVDLYTNDTYDTSLYALYKILSTAETSISVDTGIASGESSTFYVSVWRNVDSVAPFDVLPTTATGISSILANPPSITPVTSGSYIVAVGAGAANAGIQTYSSTDLTDFQTRGVNASSIDSTIGGGYYQWTSGTFDPAAFTFSTSNSTAYSWAAATVALRPTGKTYPSFIASAGVNSSTVTVPSHNAGDWLVFVSGNLTSTPPATVSGFTSVGTFANSNASLLRSGRVQYIVSDGTITTINGGGSFANVAVLRNVTGVGATSFVNTNVTTGSATVNVSVTPTNPGSICLLGSYNGGSLTGATSVTLTTNFGGRATTAPIPANISGTLTFSVSVAPCRFGAEFY